MKRALMAMVLVIAPSCRTAPPVAIEPIATAGVECLAMAREPEDVEACLVRVATEAQRAVCLDAGPVVAAAISAAIDALRGRFRRR